MPRSAPTRCRGHRLMSPEDAIEAGAMALFGEKYGDEVRCCRWAARPMGGAYSTERAAAPIVRALAISRCSGHCRGGRGLRGVRRIEALTGEGARAWLVGREDV